ncbi:MAG TPA: acyl-CoA dehydrogenase [Mycobacteriales bacterium]|nr:acyl-CoA dehydrogenase [Mycobacteriales bacterium]
MDFAFSDEQEMLRAAARAYLADRYTPERVIELADSPDGWDPASWQALANLGWLEPDLGVLEHAVLFEETGAALYPGPFFSTIGLAGPALPEDLAAAVARGERSATVAVAEPGGPASLADADRVATTADAAGRLTGHKILVPDLTSVTDVLVVARGPQGVGLFHVEAPGAVTARETIDRTRRLGELVLDATPARPLPEATSLPLLRLNALAALACEAVGVGQRALDFATEHAKTREQFGRVIGTYQAVSHKIADMFVQVQLARSLAYWAAWCVAEGDDQAPLAVAAAASDAAAAAVAACENAIQVHGGVGFTWEHPLHRFYKRAQWIQAYEGPGQRHRAAIATALLG